MAEADFHARLQKALDPLMRIVPKDVRQAFAEGAAKWKFVICYTVKV